MRRRTVEAICGRANPTLRTADGQWRRFSAAELLLVWFAEPDKWEKAAFLPAADEQLRRDVLGVPLTDEAGRRLRYVSPVEVENCRELGRRWATIQESSDAAPSDAAAAALEKRITALVEAYGKYRTLTFDPDGTSASPRRFYSRVRLAADAWRKLAGDLQAAKRISGDQRVRDLMVKAGDALQKLITQVHGGGFSAKKVAEPAVAFRQAAEQLDILLGDGTDKPMMALAADLTRQTIELCLAIYDDGPTLRLVPSLNPAALEEDRTPGDDASPWLSFRAMIAGQDDVMQAYPRNELSAVRKAWNGVKSAYSSGQSPQFATAMNDFANCLRSLSQTIEPLREKLPILHRDQELMDSTAYPRAGSTDAEVFYNRLDPFFWSWTIGLVATLCLIAAVGSMRWPILWSGVAGADRRTDIYGGRTGAALVHYRSGAIDRHVRDGGVCRTVRGFTRAVVCLAAAMVVGEKWGVDSKWNGSGSSGWRRHRRDVLTGAHSSLPSPGERRRLSHRAYLPTEAVRSGGRDCQFCGRDVGRTMPRRLLCTGT